MHRGFFIVRPPRAGQIRCSQKPVHRRAALGFRLNDARRRQVKTFVPMLRLSLVSARPTAACLLVLLIASRAFAAAPSKKVDFNRDVRPILSDNCLACHGPDEKKRKAKLRLDVREEAVADRGQGKRAVAPKNVKASSLYARITATDPDDIMPPVETHKKLTPGQIALLKRWIEEGATYQGHWAFVPPEQPPLPKVANSKLTKWPRNGIDHFILAKLDALKLTPNSAATRETLIRRVTFDLTGLPPTPGEVDEFLADKSANAFERVVDRLMKSPRYGEHQARFWLDAVRYGDTHGLHLDNERSMWPYRDWVVGAFNRNLPFNQFTIEQLAGDLLPEATRDQQIASGFNRCNVSTSEGGAIPEEFQVRYTVDRTETTSTIWMGLTLGCAVCHDHKFDPVTQREFYSLYSFFNNATENPMDGNALLPPPTLKIASPEQSAQLAEYEQELAVFEKEVLSELAKIQYTEPPVDTNAPPAGKATELVWVEDDFPAGATPGLNPGTAPLTWVTEATGLVHSGKRALKRTATGLAQDFFNGASQPIIAGSGDKFFAYVYLDLVDTPKAIMLQFHSGNWLHRANWGDDDAIEYGAKGTTEKVLMGKLPEAGKWVRLEVDAAKMGIKPGTKIDGMAFTQFGGTVFWDKAGAVTSAAQKDLTPFSLAAWDKRERTGAKIGFSKPIADALKVEPAKRNEAQRKTLLDYYLENIHEPSKAVFVPIHAQMNPVKAKRDALDKLLPSTLVMKEMEKPRGAFVLRRGEYDKKGDAVEPGVPAVLPALPKSETTNRLDLARWLVDPKHPLTARVTVNRYWQQFFGTGLVKTAGDFGSQGEFPSHPELLDWLATEFTATGWDVKKMHRLIVLSAAYRQSSQVTPEKLKADPENRFVSRGPRFRLDAEMLRDNALFVSGLLNEKMGGRGVNTYQPPGIWEAVGYTSSNTAKYRQDSGEALYRRSLYIFWKRTAPQPEMTTFDAPSREACSVRRERTNTPLQALLLMNDPQYFEAARQLAARILTKGGSDAVARLDYGFRLVTARHPSASEQVVLKESLDRLLAKYQKDADSATKVIAVGESPVNKELNPSELAAYTMVANLLLNLDEVVTKN